MAYAQDPLSVKVQPSTIEEMVDPGNSASGVLTITNESADSETYSLGTKTITGMNEDGKPSFAAVDPTNPMQLASWIVLDSSSVQLEKGKSTQVAYHLNVPEDASPGSYFAAIFVTREAAKLTQSGAGVGFQVATLVNLRVNGDALSKVQLREFSTDKVFYMQPSVIFTTRIENQGNIYERPHGVITISNTLGKEVGQVIMNKQGGGMMPQTDRVYKTEWTSDTFTLGRYTALETINYGDTEKRTVVRETSFWVVPVKEVGIFVGSLALVLLLLFVAIRSYIRRALRRAGHSEKGMTTPPANVTFAQRMVRTVVWLLILCLVLFIGMIVFFS